MVVQSSGAAFLDLCRFPYFHLCRTCVRTAVVKMLTFRSRWQILSTNTITLEILIMNSWNELQILKQHTRMTRTLERFSNCSVPETRISTHAPITDNVTGTHHVW